MIAIARSDGLEAEIHCCLCAARYSLRHVLSYELRTVVQALGTLRLSVCLGAVQPQHTFDNAFIRMGGPTATAAAPALGPTYEAEASCHPQLSAGYGGGAFTWGMAFKVETAAACCDACKAHARVCGGASNEGKVYMTRRFDGKEKEEKCTKSMGSNEGDQAILGKCNTWVFCPTPVSAGGLCWSNDVWKCARWSSNRLAHARDLTAPPLPLLSRVSATPMASAGSSTRPTRRGPTPAPSVRTPKSTARSIGRRRRRCSG